MRSIGLPWFAALGLLLTACGEKSPADTVATANDTETSAADSTSSSATDGTGPAPTDTGPGEESTTGNPSDPSSPSSPSSPSEPNPTGFILEPDGGISGQCDPKLQDCPEGEKCSAVSDAPGEPWGLNKCVPKNGTDQVGDPCDIQDGKYTGIDNCDLGLICLLTDDEGFGGACVEFCDTNDACPDTPGAKCVVYNDGSLPICLNECDPLIQDCPEGQACYNSAGDNFVCFKESAMAGEGAPGDECAYINQCQKGSFCAAADALVNCATPSCCTPYCAVSEGDAPCQMGEECTLFFVEGMAPPGYEDVGVCVVPE